MNNEIVVFNIAGEIFLFQGEPLSRKQKIKIESIIESTFDDNSNLIMDKNDYEILDWVVREIRKYTGVMLNSVTIATEFKINKPN